MDNVTADSNSMNMWANRVPPFSVIDSDRHPYGSCDFLLTIHREEKDFAHTLRSVAWELTPLFGPLSRRWLIPIKLVYDPDRPDGRLNLTASAFNQLGQYTSSPGCRGYC